jgi:hypothetical protein
MSNRNLIPGIIILARASAKRALDFFSPHKMEPEFVQLGQICAPSKRVLGATTHLS